MPTVFRRLLSSPARRPAARLRVESLESRDVPATFTVTNLLDTGAGSLRQAISDANAAAGADTITFTGAGATGTITLTSGEITVSDAVTITGPGAAALTVSGNSASRVLNIGLTTDGGLVDISGLTFANGSTTGQGGAIANNNARLSLAASTFTGNTSTSNRGGPSIPTRPSRSWVAPLPGTSLRRKAVRSM